MIKIEILWAPDHLSGELCSEIEDYEEDYAFINPEYIESINDSGKGYTVIRMTSGNSYRSVIKPEKLVTMISKKDLINTSVN